MSSKSDAKGLEPRKSRKKNREREFLTNLKGEFEEHGCFWHKISDSPIFAGMRSRYTDAKPFDAFTVFKGVPVAIEAKYLPEYKAFGINSLRDSQRDGLQDFINAGGRGFVFLNIRRVADREHQTGRLNRLLIFEYEQLVDYGRNLKKKELEQWPYLECHKKRFMIGGWLGCLEETC